MKISHQNITKPENQGYIKRKPNVAEEQLSIKLNNNYKTPLESRNISFKGVPHLFTRHTTALPFEKAMETLRKSIGSSVDILVSHIKESESMSKKVIIDKSNDTIIFKEKTPLYLLIEGLKYPFTKLPFHLTDWALKGLKKTSMFKDAKWIEKIQNKKFYKKLKLTAKDDEKLNSLRGLIEAANKYKFDSNAVKQNQLLQDASKMFDPTTGNYNGVHERALTRIVTGFIPAFFLANDAYNLSRLMNDNPKEADKEKKVRFNQESKRVLSNAYIQLITMGALSKYINKSKFAIVATTFLTVLATESYSRISNGKRVHFLSKEEAQSINAKKNKELNKPEHQETSAMNNTASQQSTTGLSLLNSVHKPAAPQSFKNSILESDSATKESQSPDKSSIFKDFSPAAIFKSSSVSKSQNKEDKKELKPLLSFSTAIKASAVIIAAGFGIKGLRRIKIDNKKPIDEFFKTISNKYSSVYKSLTEKAYVVKKDEFKALIAKMKKNGFDEMATEYNNIAEKHQKKLAIDSFKGNFIKDLESVGFKDASEFGKVKKADLIKKGIDDYIANLRMNKLDTLADTVKSTMYTGDGKLIDISNPKILNKAYSQVVKAIKKASVTEYQRPLDNVFKVNEAEHVLNQYDNVINALKDKNQGELAAKYEKLVKEALDAKEYSFGKKNKFFKPAWDFVIAPFKFIWSTITLPYRIVTLAVKMKTPKAPPKFEEGMQTLSRSYTKLSKKIAQEDSIFKNDLNENIVKSFNRLSMSGVSNAELSNLAKMSGTAATMGFLMSDNYNMVMLKSNGENKKDAQIKAKERVVQETSRLFYNMLFIDLFNHTFSSTYHNSLMGAQMINVASTVIGEYTNRAAIGMPVKAESRDTILSNEYKNITSPGAKGQFFRFMSRLTGKKVLSQREATSAPKEAEIKK